MARKVQFPFPSVTVSPLSSLQCLNWSTKGECPLPWGVLPKLPGGAAEQGGPGPAGSGGRQGPRPPRVSPAVALSGP